MGDEIIYVNGQSFDRLTHDEAVNVLKSSHRLDFVVRYIGKVPHSSLMPNRQLVLAKSQTGHPSAATWSWNNAVSSQPYEVFVYAHCLKNLPEKSYFYERSEQRQF